MLEKLKSRKFQLVLGLSLIIMGSAIHGDMTMGTAIDKLFLLVSAYLGVQGSIDLVGKVKNP